MSVSVTTLQNGVRVVTDYIDHVETASIGVWVKCGARQETEASNGIAHFLEHMAFKGTKTRNAKQIAESIESVGGFLNAYTSREATAYYAHVLKDDVALAFDILQDILNNSIFDEQELERERGVILQEIGQTFDTPDDIIFDYFQDTAYPNQSIGRPILGPVRNIKAFTRDQIKGFMDQNYCPSKLVISAAGKVDHEAICAQAEKAFGDHKNLNVAKNGKSFYEGGVFKDTRDLEQTHVVLGFEGIRHQDPDYYNLTVLAAILGDGMSSRLFQEVREKRGLVYSIYTFNSCYSDTGVFGVYAATSPHQLNEMFPAITTELKKIHGSITEEEVQKAKNQLKARLMMSMESTSGRCQRLANQHLIFDLYIPQSEILEKINAVTKDRISELAPKIFSSKMTLVGVGYLKQMPSIENLHQQIKE